MRRAAANAVVTADAPLAWLSTQARSGAAAAPAESDGHPEGAVSAQDGAGGNGVADALTLDVLITAPAVGESTSVARPAKRTEADRQATSMRLAHTDWLHHRLAIIGMAEQLAAFRRAAAGAGVIPWQLYLDRMEENVFHLLAAPSTLGGADEQGPAGRRGLGQAIGRPVAACLAFPGLATRTRARVRSSRKPSSSPFLQHQPLQREQAIRATRASKPEELWAFGRSEALPMFRRSQFP